jgi:hypothetical protein
MVSAALIFPGRDIGCLHLLRFNASMEVPR